MTTLHARRALLPDGWAEVLRVTRDTLLEQVERSPRARADVAAMVAQRLAELLEPREGA